MKPEIAMDSSSSSPGEIIMAALINLHPLHFSTLTRSLSSDLRLQHRRLSLLLLSPHHFSRTISHLHSLSLSEKTFLLARLLLRSLSKLFSPSLTARYNHPPQKSTRSSANSSSSSSSCCNLGLRDFDAALLLLSMCEVYDRNGSSSRVAFDWRMKIAEHLVVRMLSPAELGEHEGWGVIARYVDAAAKCRRLLEAVSGGREEKTGREVAASVATVVALPSVECREEGWECVVCKEEIEIGRDVCVLPCGHGFHWGCILPWLRRCNTCPYCRLELPTDDVFREIDRVWRTVVRSSSATAAAPASPPPCRGEI